MRWSKLEQIIESGFAPSVAGHVHVFVTRYAGAPDAYGRWAILIDGNEVGGLGMAADLELCELIGQFAADSNVSLGDAHVRAMELLCARAHHTLPMFTGTLHQFTNMSIDAALESPDAVVRTLALLDRRTGKRRLKRLAKKMPSTRLERECLVFRLKAEGLQPTWELEGKDHCSWNGEV
jgi:hypothetical protein